MKKLSILLIMAAGLLFSCSEDFLDTSPTDMIPEENVFSTPDGAQAVLDGVSRRIRSQASTASPDDEFGQKGIDIKWDLMGEDITCTKADWFCYDYQLDYRLAYWRRTREDWSFYYSIINNVNNIIVRENEIPFVSDAQKASIIGQALSLRAWAYFNLINIYQFTYLGHQTDPGVPVYTEPTTEGKGRGTVQGVYNVIVADLERAITLMNANPSPRRHISDIDINVTHGLYARVALQMGSWAKAESEAVKARLGYDLDTRDQFASGFSVYSKHNWIWGLETNKEQVSKYASFFSHMDMTILGYAGAGYSPKYMSRALYKKLPDRDIRKQLCDSVIDDGDYYFVNYKFNAAITGKYFAADYVMMRPEEMLLIEAEAIARQGGRDGDVLDLLDELHSVRQVSPPPVAASGSALLDSVLLERRFELWGEGFRGRDIKRLKIALDRTGSDHIQSICMYLQVPAEAPLWNYQIPQPEIDANPNISDEDQNE